MGKNGSMITQKKKVEIIKLYGKAREWISNQEYLFQNSKYMSKQMKLLRSLRREGSKIFNQEHWFENSKLYEKNYEIIEPEIQGNGEKYLIMSIVLKIKST